ncbi:MAG: YciI family protein [Terriglobia bacterium]
MSEFLYLYRRREAGRSPEKMQETMQKWTAWLKELGEKGHIKDRGHPLERAGKLVTGKQKIVTDGPFPETKDFIGGYTVIEAKGLDHAVQISLGCPIFEVGGGVEVRPVARTTRVTAG